MLFPTGRAAALVASLASLASVCSASPTPVNVVVGKPQTDLVYREALELAHQPHLDKRLSADFDMTRVWKNEVLFAGSWTDHGESGETEAVSLAVTCVDCYTKGSVTARLTDEQIINPTVRLEFHGVEAYVDMEVAMSAGAAYAVNLFSSQSPIGLGFPGLSVAVVFYVDLVFSLTDQIDLEGGFYVKLDDSAYLEASVFGGEITDHFFDGLSSKSLPVTVKAGKATFKADLRIRVQCGAETDFLGFGSSAELGIYANIIEFVAVLDSTPTCALQSTEWFDLNVGAYAHLDVVVDYTTLGAIPTVSTTLLTAPTLTQCWLPIGDYLTVTTISVPAGITPALSVIASSPAETGGYLTATTVTAPVLSGTVSSSPEGGYTETLVTVTVATITAGPSAPGAESQPAPTFKYPVGNSSVPAVGTAPAAASAGGDDLVTSTVYSTAVFTITSCAASVVNCPASYQQEILVTQTVGIYTTVCPATAVVTFPATISSSAAPSPPSGSGGSGSTATTTVDTTVVVTDVVVLVPCASPMVETFAPGSTVAAPSVRTLTATGLAAPSSPTSPSSLSAQGSSSSRHTAAAVPSAVGRVKNDAQWNNGTAYSTSAYGTGTASASWSHSVAPAPVKTSVPTAGAVASRDVARGLVVVAGGVAAWILL